MAFDATAPRSPAILRNLVPRLQIVGTRGQTLGQQSNGGGIYTRSESRYQFTLGCDASDLCLAYGNFTVGSGTGEINGPNDITVQAAIESLATTGTINQVAVSYPLFFDGSLSKVLAPGTYGALTDTAGIDGAAGDTFFARTSLSVASGLFWPRGMTASLGGTAEQCYESTNSATQIYDTGPLVAGTSGVAASYGYGPLAVLGIPATKAPAVAILGDSIAEGQGDLSAGDGLGNRGWIARGLYGALGTGIPIPYAKMTRPSDTLAQNRRSNGWRKRALWKYANILICELIINQSIPTAPSVQQAYMLDIWLSAKRRGMKVIQTLCSPQTSSTDSWATAANQTVDATFASNRASNNAYIKAAAAAKIIDGCFDPNPYFEDPANPGKWITNGTANYPTTDGTHPTSTFHIAAANAFRTWIKAYV